MNFNWFNPFSSAFLNAADPYETSIESQKVTNSQGFSSEDFEIGNSNLGWSGDVVSTYTNFKSYFSNKATKIAMYREMAYFPEISDAIDNICDSAICSDASGKYANIRIIKDMPPKERRIMIETFDYVMNEVFDFKERGWDLFRRWLIEGELFVEFTLNNRRSKIISAKVLPAFSTFPVYQSDKIIKFVQSVETNAKGTEDRFFEANQVGYSKFSEIGKSKLDIRGYLEGAIRPYNQLKNIEDALLIYRLVRAPERRLWNVEVGRLPPGKAEEHLKRLIQRYKKSNVYNSETGMVDSTINTQSLTEDFWFTKREGQGTTVETLQSGMNLGELEDVNYFLRKLYKTLKIPRSRWEDTLNTTYTAQKPGEITREEVKFGQFIGRLQERFKKVIIDAVQVQLRLNKDFEQRYARNGAFDIDFVESNVFAEHKRLQMLDTKLVIWDKVKEDIVSLDNPNAPWSKEFAMKDIYGMSDADYMKNESLKMNELQQLKDFKLRKAEKPDVSDLIKDKIAATEPEPTSEPIPTEEESPEPTNSGESEPGEANQNQEENQV